MNESLEKSYQRQRETIHELLETGRFNQIRSLLNVLRPADVAVLLESSPPKERRIVWNLFSESDQSEILHEIDEGFIEGLLADKSAEELFPVIDQIVSDDDLIDVLQHLPDTITFQLLQSMTTQDRARVETLLSYPEDTAGGLMDTDTISVRPRVSVDVVLRYLRRHETLPATTDKIFVVNSQNKYLGLVHLSKLVVSDPSRAVREIMTTDFDPINAETPETEVASKFERYDLISAPVIDKDGSLIGRITIDDVVDVIMEQADKSLLGLAGLAEDEDTFAPIFKTVRSRAIWLGANLGTAFLASAVINIFEDTIEKVVALAILMPIVASMGGVAGSQTLTLAIRSEALGQLVDSNQIWLIKRELAVGAINGFVWAAIVAAAATIVFDDMLLGGIIASALIINLLIAALAGAVLPGVLKSIGADPAISGSVVLTTITDVVGFMSFLGLASFFYA